MFTVYKVLSTICQAEELNLRYPNKHVVPVFWIHTEDHDFEEINHFFEGFGKRKTYQGSFASATGFHALEEGIRSLIPSNFDSDLELAWQPGQKLSQAYRRFFHELMGKYGLVILDASHPALKAIFKEVLEKDIYQGLAFKAVGESSKALEAAGYKLQIHPREINLFYLDEEGRNRIDQRGDIFGALDRDLQWTAGQMSELIQNRAEAFSPNVSLRPLYQEMILPNLTYFGGWGELSYWVQLKGLFDEVGENFPLLLPRFSAPLFPEHLLKEWKELGLTEEDVRKSTVELFRMYSQRLWDDTDFLKKKEEILRSIGELQAYIYGELSETLSHSAEALKVKTERFVDNLYKKANRVVRNNHPKIFDKNVEIKTQVNPDRMVPERVWSLAALKMNPREFVDWLKPQCTPLELSHKILVLPEKKIEVFPAG